MREKTIVLGGGISALSYLYYDRCAFAVAGKSDGIGGLAAIQQRVGPHLIWADEHTERLLKDLKLPTDSREILIGYLREDDTVVSREDMSQVEYDTFRDAYSYKTRGTGTKAGYMSGGVGTFRSFKVPMDEVVRKLYDAVAFRVLPLEAKHLLLWDNLVLGDKEDGYPYDHLVSTIPAPVFTRISGMHHLCEHLEARDKVYAQARYEQLPPWATRAKRDEFEYVYVADPEIGFHRVRFLKDFAVLEYTVTGIPENFDPALSVIKHPKGQIVRGAEIFRSLPPSVTLLGRFAEWNQSVKLNSVLKKVYALTDGGK
jgi:hypothetical protein